MISATARLARQPPVQQILETISLIFIILKKKMESKVLKLLSQKLLGRQQLKVFRSSVTSANMKLLLIRS